MEGGAGEGAEGACDPAPAASLSRLANIRAAKNERATRPEDGPGDGLLARTNAGVHECAEFIIQASCSNSSEFHLLCSTGRAGTSTGSTSQGMW